MLENLFLQGHASALWIINSSAVKEGRINTQAVGPVSSTEFSQAGVQWKLQPGLWDSSCCRRGNPAELGWDGAARPPMLALLPWMCWLGTDLGMGLLILAGSSGLSLGAAALTRGTCFGFALSGWRESRGKRDQQKASERALWCLWAGWCSVLPTHAQLPGGRKKKISSLKPCTYCGVH